MNAEPLIPLPKQRPNTGLEPVQLLMLFLLWALGMTLAILAFLAELMLGVKAKQRKHIIMKEGMKQTDLIVRNSKIPQKSTNCKIKELDKEGSASG